MPDGTYTGVDYLDDDGITDEPIKIAVRVEKKGDEITLDFSETDPQRRGPTNCTEYQAMSLVMYTLRCLTDPGYSPERGDLQAVEACDSQREGAQCPVPGCMRRRVGDQPQDNRCSEPGACAGDAQSSARGIQWRDEPVLMGRNQSANWRAVRLLRDQRWGVRCKAHQGRNGWRALCVQHLEHPD